MQKTLYAKFLCLFLCSLILLTLTASCSGQESSENEQKEDVPTGKVYDIDTDAIEKSYPLTDIVDISALEAAGITELTFSKDGKSRIHKVSADDVKELSEALATLKITPMIPDNLPGVEKELSCGTIINAVKSAEEGVYYFTFREDILKGETYDHPSIKFYADNAETAENIIAKYENKAQIE